MEKKKEEQGLELGFGYYNLRSRAVKLASPDELNRLKKPRAPPRPCGGRAPPRPTRREQKIINRQFRAQCIDMANVALSSYNHEQNADYVLVNPSSAYMQIFAISMCILAHGNFQARRRDDPRAPVAVFFTELKIVYHFDKQKPIPDDDPGWVSYRCSMLGYKGSLSGVNDRCANPNCKYVYHPSDRNFTYGSPEDYDPPLEDYGSSEDYDSPSEEGIVTCDSQDSHCKENLSPN